jgi:hypothetical protein
MLEIISPSITPERGVTGHALDRTQGPGCAIAAGAGTIWRNYLVPLDGQRGQTASRQLNGIVALGNALSAALALEPGSMKQNAMICVVNSTSVCIRILRSPSGMQRCGAANACHAGLLLGVADQPWRYRRAALDRVCHVDA